MKKPAAIPQTSVPKRFRRLERNEVVSRGDFVEDGRCGFKLWEGPNGFRADSFVKPIYRKQEDRPVEAKKSR